MLKPVSPKQSKFGKSSGMKKPVSGRLKQKATRSSSGMRPSSGMR